MSTTIDERVVQMTFDNKEFERNVQTSMSTIERLKQSLNLQGASRGLENVSSAARNVDMTGLSGAVETVRLKFSAMEVAAVTALANISNSAFAAGKRFLESFTTEPIKTGFQEYETQMNAVQTILANTSSAQTEVSKEAVQAINASAVESANATTLASKAAVEELKELHDDAIDAFDDTADEAMDALRKTQKQELKAYQKSADAAVKAMRAAEKDELANYQNAVDAKLDAFDAAADEELDALEDKYDEELKIFNKAIKQELSDLKTAHQTKLNLYKEEYLEKLRVTDEERYNKLKAIDDEIAALKGLTEAEAESNKEAERSRKLAELQSRVNNAIGLEERIKAETALANYKEEIAKEDLLKEREAQIEALESSKDAINAEYDLIGEQLKVEYESKKEQENELYALEMDMLKEEQSERRTILQETYNEERELLRKQQDEKRKVLKENFAAEKEAIEERYDAELEALKEQQELEKEAIQEQQAAEEKALLKQQKLEKEALLEQQKAELTTMDENLKVALENIEIEKAAQIKALSEVKDATNEVKATTLEDVNKALDELNEYADRTIYNFTEMTRNIGTFTAAGVDLDTSVAAIKGIANLAAVSGSSSQQASTAMYQLSQAISSGTVRLMDWNSVQNAGMGGQVFQNALLETARVHGIAVDQMIAENGSFRDSLQEEWLSSDILLETLQKFTGDLTEAELEAMGYTEEQIKGIIELGKTANDAATKVKTFTQLIDTLKESAQSGWSQSWRIIIGDFEEAKTLWTEVSEAFGGFIEESARLRNEMLTGWKDLGGRTVLIDAFRNAFAGVASVITPIKEAFRDIFPRTTSEQLFNMTTALRDFTEKLKLTDTQSANLKRTFKGLFSVLDIVKQTFSAVWDTVEPLVGGMGGILDAILSVTGGLGDMLTKLNVYIKDNEVFTNALAGVKTIIAGVADKLKELSKFNFDKIIENVKKFFDSVKSKISFPGLESLSDILSGIKERFSGIGGSATDMKNEVCNAFTAMGDSIKNSKVVQFLDTFWNGIKAVIGGISKAVGKLATNLGEELGDANLDTILDIFKGLTTGGVAVALIKFINSITKPFNGMKTVMKNVSGILENVGGCFKAYQNELNGNALLKIAGAIAVLTAAIVVISMLDPAKVNDSLGTMTVLLLELVGAMALLGKLGGGVNMISVAIALMAVSAALAILMSTVQKISGMTDDEFMSGVLGVAVMSALLVGIGKTLSKISGSLITASAGLIVFATALGTLIPVIALLGVLPTNVVMQGLGAIAATLLIFTVALNKLDAAGKGVSALIAVSAALAILTPVLVAIGLLPLKVIVKGLVGIGGALVIFVTALNKLKGVNKGATALIAMSAAMLILAPALALLGSLDFTTILVALGALAAVFVVFGVAAKILSPLIPAMTGLAGALALLGVAALGVGAGLLVAGLGLSAIALGFAELALAGTAGAVVLASALSIIVAGVVGTIALIAVEIGKGIITIVQTVAAGAPQAKEAFLTIISAIVGALVEAVPMVVNGFLNIVSSALAAVVEYTPKIMESIGLILSSVLDSLNTFMPTLIESTRTLLGYVSGAIVEFAPTILQTILDVLMAGIEVLSNNTDKVMSAACDLLVNFLKGISDNIKRVVEVAKDIVVNFLNAIAENLPDIIDAGVNMLVELLKSINDNIGKVIETAVDIVVSFVEGITKKMPDIIQAGFDLLLGFIQGITNAINDNTDMLVEAMQDLFLALVDAAIKILIGAIDSIWEAGEKLIDSGLIDSIKEKFEAVKEVGKNLIEGFIEGVKGMASNIKDAALGVIEGAVDSIKSFLGIHSPSRLFREIGRYSDEGLIIGLEDYAGGVNDAAEGVAGGAVNAMSAALANVSDILNSDMDTTPTIRPVLDMSNIEAGANRINALFSREQAMSISSSMRGVDSSENQNGANSTNGTTYQFTQNNYSPKALSRVEIYRQTRNQFSAIERMATS